MYFPVGSPPAVYLTLTTGCLTIALCLCGVAVSVAVRDGLTGCVAVGVGNSVGKGWLQANTEIANAIIANARRVMRPLLPTDQRRQRLNPSASIRLHSSSANGLMGRIWIDTPLRRLRLSATSRPKSSSADLPAPR